MNKRIICFQASWLHSHGTLKEGLSSIREWVKWPTLTRGKSTGFLELSGRNLPAESCYVCVCHVVTDLRSVHVQNKLVKSEEIPK